MRIVVDDIAASKTGALSVLRDFYDHILENDRENEWIFVLGDKLLEEKDNIKVLVRDDVKASRKKRLEFDLKTGASYFESLKPDLLFSMQNTLPRGYKGRQVLYVHQPLPFQTWKSFSFFKSEEREYAVYQYLIGRMITSSVRQADRVIVQTQWMKDAVMNKTGIGEDKIIKVMPDVAVPEDINKDTDRLDNSVINNRFFYPAGEILYKNHSLIMEAVGILKKRGVSDLEVSFTLKEGDLARLDKYPKYEEVKYLGRISREEVFERYRNEVLLFPSYIETFGYPPAEASAVGGRILASDCPFCHEVLKGYGKVKYFDPFRPEELADLMEQVIKGEAFSGESTARNIYARPESSWSDVIRLLEDAV
ncbi:MAG: glycosyltransferase [Lachnospiraceae bacterium]|nr:glycosyltransferase [Lachnospiraceae bacterium]